MVHVGGEIVYMTADGNYMIQGRVVNMDTREDLTEAAKHLLAEEGYDPAYGARPLKRVLQKQVQDPVAIGILEGSYPEGTTIQVDVDGDGKLSFTGVRAKPVEA